MIERLMRKTKLKGWYEFTKAVCPICHHTGGCMQYENGDVVACIRVESPQFFSKNSACPSYLHHLKGDKKQPRIDSSSVEEFAGEQKKEDHELDYIYRSLLNQLTLNDKHYEHLTSNSRQLTDKQILIREYSTFPQKPWEAVKGILNETGITDFTGIPGFYLQKGKYSDYWTVSGREGILIPFRNHKNQIVGFQYRVDDPPNEVKVRINRTGLYARVKEQPNLVQVTYNGEIILEEEFQLKKEKMIVFQGELLGWVSLVKGNRYYWLSSANKTKGTGSGNPAPIHVSVPSSQLAKWEPGVVHRAKTIWLSEGSLKCDIASDLIEKIYERHELEEIGTTFLATPGANSWRLALPVMKEMGVEQVNICIDADAASNVYVKRALIELAKELKEQNYKANLVLWSENEAKGIDDLLLLNLKPHIKKLF